MNMTTTVHAFLRRGGMMGDDADDDADAASFLLLLLSPPLLLVLVALFLFVAADILPAIAYARSISVVSLGVFLV
jgi:hypothetical protein